jgi:hypothetical protein
MLIFVRFSVVLGNDTLYPYNISDLYVAVISIYVAKISVKVLFGF